jgi:hypothetical protein
VVGANAAPAVSRLGRNRLRMYHAVWESAQRGEQKR